MGQIIERYLQTSGTSIPQIRENYQVERHNEMINEMRKETLNLQLSLQRYKGEDLKSAHFDELALIEQQIEHSLSKVRARKVYILHFYLIS